MSNPRRLNLWKAWRLSLAAARRERTVRRESLHREARQKAAGRHRGAKRDAAARKQGVNYLLDRPSVWLKRRRAKKMRREENLCHALLGAGAPPLTAPARLRKAARAWLAGVAADRERLWRRSAGLLGAAFAVSLAANLLMYLRFTPARPLVTIGGRVIQNREYQAYLEQAAGKPVLVKLVFSELIGQAAARAGITPAPAQVDARLAQMERGGAPHVKGAEAVRLREDVRLGLALENLRMQGIPAGDAEIADFYRKNAAQLAQPARVQSILVVTRSEFEAQTATRLLEEGQTASQVAAQPEMRVDGENGFRLSLDDLPPALHRTIVTKALAMQPGQITTLPLGRALLTIKCLLRDAPSQPSLAQSRDQIARLVRLSKAPSADAELAQLYQANRPDFDMDRYAAYLGDMDHADPSAPPAVSKSVGVSKP